MPTCPDCGSIILEGDPYCSHCGAHLVWSEDSHQTNNQNNSLSDIISREIIASPARKEMLASKVVELVQSRDTSIERIDLDIDNAVFIFKRQNRYIKTVIRCLFRYLTDDENVFESFEVENDYSKLKEDESFKSSVKNVESEIGKRFSHISGSYEVKSSLTGEPVFGDKCEVSVFFRTSMGGFSQYFVNLDTMKLTSAIDSLLDELKNLR